MDLRVTLRDRYLPEYETIILENQPSKRYRDVLAVVKKIEDLDLIDPMVISIVINTTHC